MALNEPVLKSRGKSKSTPTVNACSPSTGQMSGDTQTSRRSTGRISNQLTFFVEDHPVNHSAFLENGSVHQIRGTCGQKLYRRLELYGRDGLFLRTLLASSGTLPRASSLRWNTRDMPIRHGEKSSRLIYRLALSGRHIADIESGLLPTLRANKRGFPDSHGNTTAWMKYLLPTLKASDGSKGIRTAAGTARERERRKNGLDLPTVLGGRVHPTFAEWMFGYPIGHTVLDRSEIASSRKSRNGLVVKS